MPNPWDLGTAKLLEAKGFAALATTSWGLAFALGRSDYGITRQQLVDHVGEMSAAIAVPLNVDAEDCFPAEAGGVARTVQMLADAGAAGCSIEDYDARAQRMRSVAEATEAVANAAVVARETGLVLTARAENAFYGLADLDDTIVRLKSYVAAGAEVAYAPGLTNPDEISRVVREVGAPVNVLARPNGPTVEGLAALGVRRVSTGGAICRQTIVAIEQAVDDLLAGSSPILRGSSAS